MEPADGGAGGVPVGPGHADVPVVATDYVPDDGSVKVYDAAAADGGVGRE